MKLFLHARSRLFSIFIPVMLWGDLLETDAAQTQYVRKTKATLRLEEESRRQNEQIRAMRQKAAAAKKKAGTQSQGNTAAVNRAKRTPVQNQTVYQNQSVRKVTAVPATSSAVKTQVAAKTPSVRKTPSVKIRYSNFQNRPFALVQDVARFYGMSIRYLASGVVLQNKTSSLMLQYEKRQAYLNGTMVYLSSAPVRRGALIYVDSMDFLRIIDPVLRGETLWKHRTQVVMIDPGHGGSDQGAPGPKKNLVEKNLNLAMAMKVARRLRKLGWTVLITRSSDRTLSLQQRADMCERYKPDLFISMHCNASVKTSIAGIETYALTPRGGISTSDSKPGGSDGKGYSFDRNSYRLAFEVQKHLVWMTKGADRGVRHARFFVLRNASCPAILVESGFISNSAESKLLNQPAYQDKIATAICSAVSAYVRLLNAK